MAEENQGQGTGNPDGGGDESFLDSITDEELRAEPSLQSIGSLDDLAKSYVHAQRMVGRDKLPLPAEEDDEDGWNEVYNRLGRPEDPKEYDFGELPSKDKDGFEVPEDYLEGLRGAAHAAGITQKQLQALVGFDRDYTKDQFAESEAALDRQFKEAEKTMRREYGKTYDAKIDKANRVLSKFGGEELIDKLEKFGLSNNPDMIRMMVQVGELLGEDAVPHGESAGSGLTPNAAKAEIAKLKMDDKFMAKYTDQYTTGHAEAVQKMQELYDYAYPTPSE